MEHYGLSFEKTSAQWANDIVVINIKYYPANVPQRFPQININRKVAILFKT